MNATEWTYVVFGIVMVIALVFDLGPVEQKIKNNFHKAGILSNCFLDRSCVWVFFYLFGTKTGKQKRLEYISAYLMEWSLSIDNIFVFILIFSYFGIARKIFEQDIVARHFDCDYFKGNFYNCWNSDGTKIFIGYYIFWCLSYYIQELKCF